MAPVMIQETSISGACEEKRRLFVAYQRAGMHYSQLVRQLAEAAGTVIDTEYEFLNRKVKRARKLSRKAREQLNKHKSEHKC